MDGPTYGRFETRQSNRTCGAMMDTTSSKSGEEPVATRIGVAERVLFGSAVLIKAIALIVGILVFGFFLYDTIFR
jgi:hypothetical protein